VTAVPVAARLPEEQSAIRAMTERCRLVGGVNLGQGLCRVPPPDGLLARAAGRLATATHTYGPAEGTSSFREAAASKVSRHNHVDVDPATGIVATVGATGGLSAVLLGLLSAGDEVLLPEPFYGYHLAALRAFGLTPRSVELRGDAWTLTAEALRCALTPATKAVLVCTPGNPTGHRLGPAEIDALADVAAAHDLLVIADEVYEHIYFDPAPHLSPASHVSLTGRTVTATSLSKTFSIPGWRLGYAYGPERLISRVRLAADTLVVCPPTPLQDIAADLLNVDDSYYGGLREGYARRLDRLATAFVSAGCDVRRPEGAYYALVDLGRLGLADGTEAADVLLERCGVATVPLEAFQLDGPPRPVVRACFSVPEDELDRLPDRLEHLRGPVSAGPPRPGPPTHSTTQEGRS